MSQAIGIDLGGTRIKGALIDMRMGVILHQLLTPTGDGESGNWQQTVADIAQALTQLATEPIRGIGVSAPGLPSADNKTIACMPGRLMGLEGFDWSTYLSKPVRVLNDAHAALMAEVRFGALKNVLRADGYTDGITLDGTVDFDGYNSAFGDLEGQQLQCNMMLHFPDKSQKIDYIVDHVKGRIDKDDEVPVEVDYKFRIDNPTESGQFDVSSLILMGGQIKQGDKIYKVDEKH